MTNYQIIVQKIETFIRKYYTNDLIRGVILFLSIGLFYFLFTLFVEYFLWLTPLYRTILFWVFIAIELVLLYRFILFPLLKLFGLQNGLNHVEASRIIGKHFPDIDDKLLNMLQLQHSHPDSELVAAGIDRKALQLKPFSFQTAIDFKANTKYLKFLTIPVFAWLLIYFLGYQDQLLGSYNRLVHHQEHFLPPAPFHFELLNQKLSVIEGNSIELLVKTEGQTIPEEAYIVIENEPIYLNRLDNQTYSYTLSDVKQEVSFYFEANKVRSKPYVLTVLPIPQVQHLQMLLHYPPHIHKVSEVIENTGNAVLPEGTQVTWQIISRNTSKIVLNDSIAQKLFSKNKDYFTLSKNIRQDFEYSISTSNQFLQSYENLPFSIQVIKDALPQMNIETDIDSLTFGEAHFVGRLSDDYGLTKLLLHYYPISKPTQTNFVTIPIKTETLSDFNVSIPGALILEESTEYEFYFEVFDNDKVNGFKSVKSKTYRYRKDSDLERNEKLLEQQQENIKNMNQILDKQEKNQKELEQLQNQLQNKSEIKFNEKQHLQHIMNRQQQYEQLMQRKTDELKENLQQQPDTKNNDINQKKDDIQKRIDELKTSEEQKKLLEELQKMADKLQKEDLLDKIKQMSTQNKQKEKSLEQLLELTKRFYVEQKAQQISEKLAELAKKQEDLKNSEQNNKDAQEQLNDEFKAIQQDINDMMQQNKELKKPMSLDAMKPEQEAVKQDMQQASEQLEQTQKTNAKKKQQSAAIKMKQMSQAMQQMMMDMQGDSLDEDIASLRRIIKNLITFSYEQEALMDLLKKEQQAVTNLSTNLKKQNQLKTYFQHIDDSLYTLAMRQAKISNKINEYLANAHYYLSESESSLSEALIPKTRANQQYVMTAANDLAAMLSSLLDNLQNQMSMGMGQGQGNPNQPDFGLPDMIQKQGAIKQKMKGMGNKEGKEGEQPQSGDKGKAPSDKGKDSEGESGGNGQQGKQQGDSEQQSQELYDIYKQQALLREALEKQLDNLKGVGLDKQADNLIKQMEQVEKLLIEKGITLDVQQRIERMEHELLKLKNAAYDKGLEEKRRSTPNEKDFQNTNPKAIELLLKKLNQQELLNREPIPFQPNINQKVIEYFQKPTQP